ncbi:MAG: Rossman fold protein, TIGR00730 family [Gammaproteobacteria bacterium RIFCSPHIGHO2_02_FULL_42_13]|nr:MAG: Rossman fold protein, TIGR00730 family [Gammaproteobacteria bacterium RIFCSPHIGHO2_02_FULL_42_13]OGT67921.1 MAG: Rossman fold protein, TIGR00730 family [Gammaproteobacteria bacterium RIFCSPLOWO2_02_FULL_42_9]
MNRLCVFMGAQLGINPSYRNAVQELADTILKHRLTLVYGGARMGLMGQLANQVLEKNGKVIGVITEDFFQQGIAHPELTELCIVSSMSERKRKMAEMSDGFVALPGGLGTLEELFEILNAAKIGLHQKPVGLLNIDHYFNRLIEFIDQMVKKGFLMVEQKNILKVSENPADLIFTFLTLLNSSKRGESTVGWAK